MRKRIRERSWILVRERKKGDRKNNLAPLFQEEKRIDRAEHQKGITHTDTSRKNKVKNNNFVKTMDVVGIDQAKEWSQRMAALLESHQQMKKEKGMELRLKIIQS